MATIKSFTDLEQSRKLAEILPLESADMVYVHTTDLEGDEHYDIDFRNNQPLFEDDIPAWSLAALLGVLPRIEHLKPFIDLGPKLDSNEVAIYYHSEDSPYIVRDNLVDACYEMILKLHELKNVVIMEKKRWKPNMAQINALTAAIKQVDKGNADVLKGLKGKLMEL